MEHLPNGRGGPAIPTRRGGAFSVQRLGDAEEALALHGHGEDPMDDLGLRLVDDATNVGPVGLVGVWMGGGTTRLSG